MKFLSLSAAALLGFANLSLAGPLYAAPIIEHAAPKSVKCDAKNEECRTAKQAAPHIVQGLFDHGIYDVKEMAAVISLMAFESGDFQYKRNKFPGRPGQGTANMQMPQWNLLYAQSIPELKSKWGDVKTIEGMTNETLNALLDDVVDDKYNFASGPWFLTTQCEPKVREALRKDIDAGFKDYMDCVDVKIDEGRLKALNLAKEAFGLKKC
ncbi:hypothetical protein CDV36_001432 [Fusarium kuroshium]|uniref:Uncharacterized protein n=3 Tax=Fusarium solani species complex TaxID=232080 RepID=A0A3M2SMU8_9HYPO|nr:hypothetical protein CDV36_001432 [Fusarium kuroshium]RSL75596.1 hypothetical protein CEP51_010727 [Fusarium floridanum]RSM12389.1 hypothetical protein CEP52_002521 [Fusarium oligoseptatum]